MMTSDFQIFRNGLDTSLRPRLDFPHVDNPYLVFA